MNQLKAIETNYKGYRFRSRTEARWAVFFDLMGIEWEYEKEGYELKGVGCYLPDFWLPKWRMHLEVKGQHATDEEKAKCKALRDQSERAVLLVHGPFGNEDREIFAFDTNNSSGGSSEWWFNFEFTSRPFISVDNEYNEDRIIYADHDFQEPLPNMNHCTIGWLGDAYWYRLSTTKEHLDLCTKQAKSARFEFGETPE